MSNPVDEYLKLAAIPVPPPSWMSEAVSGLKEPLAGHHIGRMAGGAGLAALAIGGTLAAKKIMGAISKKREFEAMMEHDPELAGFHAENPKQFNSHYNSFRSMNPLFAKDPVVSAQYMRQMNEFPGNAGKIIVESLQGVPKSNRGAEVGFDGKGARISIRG